MTLEELFGRTLEIGYTELKENAASFAAERKGDVLFLFFEKSNGATDWRNNLDFPAKPYRRMADVWFVHRGFLRVFSSIEPHLRPLVGDGTVKRVVISGYSHGAALALLAHEYVLFRRPDLAGRVRGFGFGCPRAVWGPLPRRVRERFRGFTVVRNGRDLVTHLPPVLFGFRHVGAKRTIGETRGMIADHLAENYRLALSALRKRKGEGR